MISKNGIYWSTGITVHQNTDTHGWAASLDYLDDGFVNDDPDAGRVSTEGTLRTRYFVRGTGTTLPNERGQLAGRARVDLRPTGARRVLKHALTCANC